MFQLNTVVACCLSPLEALETWVFLFRPVVQPLRFAKGHVVLPLPCIARLDENLVRHSRLMNPLALVNRWKAAKWMVVACPSPPTFANAPNRSSHLLKTKSSLRLHVVLCLSREQSCQGHRTQLLGSLCNAKGEMAVNRPNRDLCQTVATMVLQDVS